jgi:hypothetical protein
LAVTPKSSGRKWILLRAFTFAIGSRYGTEKVTVPKGFETDFASVDFVQKVGVVLALVYIPLSDILPWWAAVIMLFPILFYSMMPLWWKYGKSPILHDYLYQYKGVGKYTRRESDQVFLESMLVDWREHRAGVLLANIEYFGVRCFGWLSWKRK